MTRFPREPLDADERALAAALPRPHGRGEPDAALDARILAAAHAAAQTPAKIPRKRRWTVPLGLAASLCLALGLAWRTQLDAPRRDAAPIAHAEPSPPATFTSAPAPAEDDGIATPQAESAPVAAETPQPASASPSATVPRPVSPPVVMPAAPAEPAVMPEIRSILAMVPPMPAPAAAAPLPPPPAPPAPPAPPPIATADTPRAFASEASPPPPRALAAAPAAAKARGVEPAQRAFAMQADAPVEDVPPATADAPEVREAWLRRIGELMRQGKLDMARASLAEFRRRYPDAAVPVELHPLEQPPAPPGPDPAAH